ncbi:O10A5 protein, partial [Oreotrochilus melanogaster]|nr:O10A5 protein [Oreotrochilus melanogaster]
KPKTIVTEFILLGFGNGPETESLFFLVFLSIYIATITGNTSIIVLTVANRRLHTPMYFFLGNLACLEICYSSSILPRLLLSYLGGDRSISVRGCITQYYFFDCLAAAECYLLAVMSYDRYLAVCRPLHYPSHMGRKLCLQQAAASWISGFLSNSVLTFLIAKLDFCGPNEIEHFFCVSFPMIKLTTGYTYFFELLVFIATVIIVLIPFALIAASYIQIIHTILQIPSAQGRRKAFFTCLAHLVVVTLFYCTTGLIHLQPSLLAKSRKLVALSYTVVTPMLNPIIYSLRNKEVKHALRKTF